jgi:hypothetical protein
MDIVKQIKYLSSKCNYYEDLYMIFWKLFEYSNIQKKHFQTCSVGLFNIPCGGFGDIIICKTFYDYLQSWYPGMKVTICSSTPEKYKDLGVNSPITKLHLKKKYSHKSPECKQFSSFELKKKMKFDAMIVVPIINREFNIKEFQSLIPYANISNTFSMGEYNGDYEPYTFPTGVGHDNLGILFNKYPIKQQKLIRKPYAMIYIQPQPEWGIHSRYCFLSYIEMICKKYRQKHHTLQVVVPDWITEDILYDTNVHYKLKNILKRTYGNMVIVYKEDSLNREVFVLNEKDNSKIIFRGDILPQERSVFISLMKDSLPDILVTGDQSITDIMSCCKRKQIWYQIAPWKKGFSEELSKHLPNKYYETFKTSCGTLKSIKTEINWKKFMKNYDFRIHGKKRMDSVLQSVYHMKNNDILKHLLHIIEHSRYLETAQEKMNKL